MARTDSDAPLRPLASVTGRTVLVAVVVAIVAVGVAAAVAIPVIRSAADSQARANLARAADITVEAVVDPRPGELRRIEAVLSTQSAQAYLVGNGLVAPDGVDEDTVEDLVDGRTVSDQIQINGNDWYLEGRPLGDDKGLVLLAPATNAQEPLETLVGGLLLALMVGLTLAVLVAVVASRRMTRPLRRAADAAEQLAAGQRDVRIEPEGPTEVAELAESMNRLASALAVSENRQREFLLSVSHELRTPLTAVQGYAEAIAEEVVPAEEVPQAAEVLTAESKRLERLVADLLDLSRLGAADLKIMRQPVNLTDLLSDAAQVWRDRCARVDVQFRAEIPATPVLADTDPLRYRQILDNLAENALRVTPADAPIVFALSAHDHWAVLQVRDGGPGLAPQDLDVAFEPAVLYTRYRGVRPVGSGIGLALVGRLAQRLGGTAKAGSAPEGGALFEVRVPIVTPEGRPTA